MLEMLKQDESTNWRRTLFTTHTCSSRTPFDRQLVRRHRRPLPTTPTNCPGRWRPRKLGGTDVHPAGLFNIGQRRVQPQRQWLQRCLVARHRTDHQRRSSHHVVFRRCRSTPPPRLERRPESTQLRCLPDRVAGCSLGLAHSARAVHASTGVKRRAATHHRIYVAATYKRANRPG